MVKALVLGSILGLGVVGAALAIPVGGQAESRSEQIASGVDLSRFSDQRPDESMNLLFVHHSVGGQLLAAPGASQDIADSIHKTHPNGGGLRSLLKDAGYKVHEASYGSKVGEDTDLFHWAAKFRQQMDEMLKTRLNDAKLANGEQNDIVVFKSCYPNNRFVGEGVAPGDPDGPELTLWNAKAAMSSLLDITKQRADVLFVYMTAPPNAPGFDAEPLGKVAIKKILGKPSAGDVLAERARLAREFNNWVISPEGWLAKYPLQNVIPFDYYGVLTDQGASNLSRYPSGDGSDSHPNSEGQQKAARAFVPFLNRAVRRAELGK